MQIYSGFSNATSSPIPSQPTNRKNWAYSRPETDNQRAVTPHFGMATASDIRSIVNLNLSQETGRLRKNEVIFHTEKIGSAFITTVKTPQGQILGTGIGTKPEEAKQLATKEATQFLKCVSSVSSPQTLIEQTYKFLNGAGILNHMEAALGELKATSHRYKTLAGLFHQLRTALDPKQLQELGATLDKMEKLCLEASSLNDWRRGHRNALVTIETKQMVQDNTEDLLTEIHNRRFFETAARIAFQHSVMHKSPLSIIYLDLDRFKGINDTFGHEAGDTALQKFAKALQEALQGEGVLCRLAGDEFAIILPNTDQRNAREIAKRIRQHVEGASFKHKGREIHLATSQGICTVNSRYKNAVDAPVVDNWQEVVKLADLQMMEGKKRAKNTTENRIKNSNPGNTQGRHFILTATVSTA